MWNLWKARWIKAFSVLFTLGMLSLAGVLSPRTSYADTVATTLYDQSAPVQNGSRLNGYFTHGEHANDFVVPQEIRWNIQEVILWGDPKSQTTYTITFYNDNNGSPGTQRLQYGNLTPSLVEDAGFLIKRLHFTLPTPASLLPGTYWLAVSFITDGHGFAWLIFNPSNIINGQFYSRPTAGSWAGRGSDGQFLLVGTSGPPDETPPEITYTLNPATPDGANDWYRSNVSLTWTVTEPESPDSLNKTGCADQHITTDQPTASYSCAATSDGGSANVVEVTIKRDATAPTINPTVAPNPVTLNGTATATQNAQDNLSGIGSQSCNAVDTSSVGLKSVSCSGTDVAGNSTTASANYRVAYDFIGFSSPVNNNNVLNSAKAGQTIPLKWRLLDAAGNPVTNLSSATVKVQSLACGSGTSVDPVEEYATGSSGLQNLGDGYYQFNWKTPTSYAKSCKTMQLDLGEGAPRTALFQFTK